MNLSEKADAARAAAYEANFEKESDASGAVCALADLCRSLAYEVEQLRKELDEQKAAR